MPAHVLVVHVLIPPHSLSAAVEHALAARQPLFWQATFPQAGLTPQFPAPVRQPSVEHNLAPEHEL